MENDCRLWLCKLVRVKVLMVLNILFRVKDVNGRIGLKSGKKGKKWVFGFYFSMPSVYESKCV